MKDQGENSRHQTNLQVKVNEGGKKKIPSQEQKARSSEQQQKEREFLLTEQAWDILEQGT